MAHSPLFRSVCALLREVAASSSRRDPRANERLHLDRRRFLCAAGAAVGATALHATGIPLRRNTARIAIVGGGLAGLTCAYRLQQAGIESIVYEANTRFGGRCWTRRGDFADGQIAEHGGELIDQGHTSIRHLAQELRLPLANLLAAEAQGTEPCYWFAGQRYAYRDATRDLRAIWQTMHRDLVQAGYPTTYRTSTARGRELDAMSLADWIRATVPGGLTSPLGQLLSVAYAIEYGAEVEEQSALNLLYLLAYSGPGQLRVFGPSNEKYHVIGGNDQIPARLAAQLAPQLVPQHHLVAVTRRPDGRLRLGFATPGGAVEEDFELVVFALPFGVLRNLDLSGTGWSARKLLAIDQLGRGANSKLNVQFATRHWLPLGCTGETYSDRGYQASWEVSRGQPGTAGILVDYSGGAIARSFAGASPALRAQQFAAQIEALLPGSVAGLEGHATLDTWHDNPLTGCSYSFWKVGQYTLFSGVEGEPEGNAFFCGEHTSQDNQGYLEGAVETGERAAREVVDALVR